MLTSTPQTVLIVAAHPDDEVLGFGGTARVLSTTGNTVHSAIVVGEVEARRNRPGLEDLYRDTDEAHRLLGMELPTRGLFPNIKLNTVPHLDLVGFIEQAIVDTEPDVVVTVHPGDINDDHLQVSRACQAAVRLPQRQPDVKPIHGLLFMEILSSTDWRINSVNVPFIPQMYVEIGENSLDSKLEAFHHYRGVMRPYPHPRSDESVRALATLRGSESGMHYAEAFQVGFWHNRKTR
jgi:LmbE family N-acetylglucosaminyl deacetylase